MQHGERLCFSHDGATRDTAPSDAPGTHFTCCPCVCLVQECKSTDSLLVLLQADTLLANQVQELDTNQLQEPASRTKPQGGHAERDPPKRAPTQLQEQAQANEAVLEAEERAPPPASTQSTCFTSAKVQILTTEELLEANEAEERAPPQPQPEGVTVRSPAKAARAREGKGKAVACEHEGTALSVCPPVFRYFK